MWEMPTISELRPGSDSIRLFGREEITQPWLPCLRVKTSRGYELGVSIGRHFSVIIHSRSARDPHLHSEMLPFAASEEGQQLISALSTTNREKYPEYWNEMLGTADGSGVPFLQVLLLNMKKEIAPFLPSKVVSRIMGEADQCSDVLVCNDNLGCIAHNEDADVSLLHHVYLVHAELEGGLSFIAYTYAGELPSCAFGFNSYGVAFTLNAVPLAPEEATAGGIARNFVSRDLLEASNMDDALKRAQVDNLSVGHNYNIMDINLSKIVNLETASKGRFSIREIGTEPFFHANMYLHLQVSQVSNESSLHRQNRAAQLSKLSKEEVLSLLGDVGDDQFPIYMQGPKLTTLATVVFNMYDKTWTIYQDNPGERKIYFQFPLLL